MEYLNLDRPDQIVDFISFMILWCLSFAFLKFALTWKPGEKDNEDDEF